MRTKKAFALTTALLMMLAMFTVVSMTSIMGNSDDYDKTHEQLLAKGKPQPPSPQTYPLFDITKNAKFGTVSMWNDNKYLYIQANTLDTWNLWYFRAAVAASLSEIPTGELGNPDVARWSYLTINQPADDVSSATFKIPKAWDKGTQLYIGTYVSAAYGADTSNWIEDFPGSYQYPGIGPSYSHPYYVVYTVTKPGKPTTTPTPDPLKDEPLVTTSWSASYPFGGYVGHPAPVYGDPTKGMLYTGVAEQADATRIGIMVYFVGLSSDEVYVNATTPSGQPLWINLYNDGRGGCYGLLMEDPSTIDDGVSWTWMYSGSATTEQHDISITATFYKLGSFLVRTCAYDQETGQMISDIQTFDFTVVGSGGKYYDLAYMFDNGLSGPYNFVPGEMYDIYLTDTSRIARYEGMVRSVLSCPYVQNMWMVNGDGSLTLMEKDANGKYSWTWYHSGGISSHSTHLLVQLGEAGGGPYPYSSGDYYTVDDQTNILMSHVNGMSHPGAQIYLQSL